MNALRDLQAATRYRKFSSEQDLDTFLRERFPHATAEERIAAKLQLAAERKFQLRASQDRTPGPLAIDAGLQHLLDRIGVRPGRGYDEHHVDQMLQDGGITDIETRLRLKAELGMRNQLWR